MKKILLYTFLNLLILLSFHNAHAIQEARVSSNESRFRTYVYNPNEIYKFTGHYIYQSYIEFENGETVNTISMGDSTAWQMVTLGNKLFLKPVSEYAETNMTLITNKRIYHFQLDAKQAKSIDDEDMIFYVKFVYPDEEDKTIVIFNVKTEREDYPDLSDLSKYNFNYEFSGSQNIAPAKVFDDGEFTYLQFSNKNSEIPAIFLVNTSGYESLVNFRIIEEYVIVERVNSQFTLRSGEDIVCIYNNSLYRHKN